MLNSQKKKEQKKLPKLQNFNFHSSFNDFGRNPPQEYIQEFWVANLVCSFREDVICNLITPMWSHVNESEKRIQNLKFRNSFEDPTM